MGNDRQNMNPEGLTTMEAAAWFPNSPTNQTRGIGTLGARAQATPQAWDEDEDDVADDEEEEDDDLLPDDEDEEDDFDDEEDEDEEEGDEP